MKSIYSDLRLKKWVVGGCYFLIILWAIWWAISLTQNDLLLAKHLWFGEYPSFGKDFLVYVDHPTRMWLDGGDPYASKEIIVLPPTENLIQKDYYAKPQLYAYSPLVLRMFSWIGFMSSQTALRIYIMLLCVFALLGARASWRTHLCIRKKKNHLYFLL